jgi:glutamate dehydrogenase
LLTHHPKDLGIERAVRRYAAPIAELSATLADTLTVTDRARLESHRARLVEQHLPEDLASRIASLDVLHSALDLVEVAKIAGLDVGFAARVYFNLGERIGLTWIRDQIDTLAAEGQWQAVARGTLSDNLYELQRRLTASILAGNGGTAERRVDRWLGGHATGVDSLKRIVVDLRTGAAADFATLSVALQAVRRLAQD